MPKIRGEVDLNCARVDGYLTEDIQKLQIHVYRDIMEHHNPNNLTVCCVPSGCNHEDGELINLDSHFNHLVKIACNNEHCTVGTYMHQECFETWEQSVLTYLRSTGRARSWSEKQRLQNLWTKKGYDLAFKACGCKCGKGHLRKDLNWMPPTARMQPNDDQNANNRKKRQRKKRNDKPALGNGSSVVVTTTPATTSTSLVREGRPMLRIRSNSMSSTGSSPPSGASSTGESPKSPTHMAILSGSPGSSGILYLAGGINIGGARRRRSSTVNGDRIANVGIFSRRVDYSSFNMLPRHKINSYHIKMEDEGNCGNDETRCFVLSNLAAARLSRVTCVLCKNSMLIFDQYPLIDGTFFLSPRQHSSCCLPVKVDGKNDFLSAVCMGCLEGWNCVLRCQFCLKKWNGTSLIMGTMYSYDIFAANPCCMDRLRCNNCHKLVVLPEQRCNYFSDYSNSLPCPHCDHVDFHFVKSLSTYLKGEHE
ncbi:hypothetical protein CHUAL_011436 [Chamberlinius hualienensis]